MLYDSTSFSQLLLISSCTPLTLDRRGRDVTVQVLGPLHRLLLLLLLDRALLIKVLRMIQRQPPPLIAQPRLQMSIAQKNASTSDLPFPTSSGRHCCCIGMGGCSRPFRRGAVPVSVPGTAPCGVIAAVAAAAILCLGSLKKGRVRLSASAQIVGPIRCRQATHLVAMKDGK